MRKTILLGMLAMFAFSASAQDYKQLIAEGNYTVAHISSVAELHFDTIGRDRGTGYKPFKRWQYFANRAMDETGKLKSPEFYYNELEHYNTQINKQGVKAKTVVGTWEEMGPTYWNATSGWNPGVGRITAIAIETANLNHIIAGANTGGVWKSLDGGSTWSVLTDNLANIDVYALAIDPLVNTTYYWGSKGGSLFKSTDSGATWNLHATLSGTINKILIHPTDSSKMYASAQGGGLYKSTDGGVTWNSIFFVPTNTGFDIEFKPNDPNTIYASGNAFYKSTNGGASFTNVLGTGQNQFSTGPKMIGVSPNNAAVVYVVEASGGVFGGLYKSTDSGSTFTKLDHTGKNYFGYSTTASDDRGQAPRDMDIAVNPNDANDVHIAGINTWRSTNGGAVFNITSQWTPNSASNLNIGYCHADVDFMQFVGTGTNTKLFVGSDGGIFKADNPTTVTTSYYTDLTSGMGIRQFYKIGISQTNPIVVSGGSQDNGTSVLTNGNWTDWLGADGMETFVDKNNAQIIYGTTQNGGLNKTTNGGATRFGLTAPLDGNGDEKTGNWVTPFEQDPTTPNTIYVGYDEVYKSVDGGNTWVSISQNFGNNLDQLKIAASNNQVIYMSLGSNLWKTENGGATSWTQLSGFTGSINAIAIHPTDPSRVAIATTGNEKVYVTTDSGATWNSIKWDLPNFSAQALTWHNNGNDGLYVGMNFGIYYTDNVVGNTWKPFNNGLPNVRINELEINTVEAKIYAATYGRGLWRSNVYDSSVLNVNDFKVTDFQLYPNPASSIVNLKWNTTDTVSVRVFNTLGKLMYYANKVSLADGIAINTSTYNTGLYFVKLSTKNGEITKKLIIK